MRTTPLSRGCTSSVASSLLRTTAPRTRSRMQQRIPLRFEKSNSLKTRTLPSPSRAGSLPPSSPRQCHASSTMRTGCCAHRTSKQPGCGVRSGHTNPLMLNCESWYSSPKSPPYPHAVDPSRARAPPAEPVAPAVTPGSTSGARISSPWSHQSQTNPPCTHSTLRTTSQNCPKLPFELPMACWYSHITTGRLPTDSLLGGEGYLRPFAK
mmetsp:Transcript_43407/g.107282  ORF Transcript_43407/g.107282 Transcript_43407/m.107282 type:complete len:209 (+) Transcript_43407:134-760(+)